MMGKVNSAETSPDRVKAYLKWHSEWNSGNEVIDQQHKVLLSLCEPLVLSVLEQNEKFEVVLQLQMIFEHITHHFKYEEEILETVKYDELEIHKVQHYELLEQARTLMNRAAQEELEFSEVVDYIVNNIVKEHLLEEDVKFFELMREQAGK